VPLLIALPNAQQRITSQHQIQTPVTNQLNLTGTSIPSSSANGNISQKSTHSSLLRNNSSSISPNLSTSTAPVVIKVRTISFFVVVFGLFSNFYFPDVVRRSSIEMFPIFLFHSMSQSQANRASFCTYARPEADRRRNRTRNVRKNGCHSPQLHT
jgi:hypothetical protein